jgi:hypothetical protein
MSETRTSSDETSDGDDTDLDAATADDETADDTSAGNGEADDGEASDSGTGDDTSDGNGEADDGEADDGEADDGEADDGEADDGEADDGEASDGEATGDEARGDDEATGDASEGEPAGADDVEVDATAAADGRDEPAGWVRRVVGTPWLAPAVVIGAVMALPLWGMVRSPGPPMEEGFMLVFPERLLEGDIPNKDFLHLYGPGSLWFIAALYRVLGVELWVERLAGLLQLVGVVSGVAFAASRWGRWAAVVAGTTTAVLIMPPTGLVALAWIGGLALAVWTVVVAVRALDPGRDDRSRKRALVGGGLLAGAALLFRPDLVVALGLPLGAMWLWGLDRTGRRQLLGGMALGVSPYLVHLALAGPGNAITGIVLEPVFDLRPGRTLPFPPVWDRLSSSLDGVLVIRDWPWLPLPHLEQPQQVFVWVWILFAVVAAVAAVGYRARRSDSPEGWRLLALGLLCVGILPQAIQRPDTAHLAWVSAVPFGLAVPALVEWTRLRAGRRAAHGEVGRGRWPWARAVLPLAPLLTMLVVIPHFTIRSYADYVGQTVGYRRHAISPEEAAPCMQDASLPICYDAIVEIENRGRSFYYGRPSVAAAAQRLVDDVDQVAEPGQRLVVGTGDLRKTAYSESYLYFLLPQLEPGTQYIEMDPGVANAEDSGLADELRHADVVILSTVYDSWDEPNTSTDLGSDEPNQVLADEYCLEESYGSNELQAGRGWYELYVRC